MKKKINLARAYVVRAKGITRAVLKRHGMTNAATGKVIHVAPATIGRWLDDQTPTFFDLEHAAAIIERIRTQDVRLADTLQRYIDDFEYERIVSLIQDAASGKGGETVHDD